MEATRAEMEMGVAMRDDVDFAVAAKFQYDFESGLDIEDEDDRPCNLQGQDVLLTQLGENERRERAEEQHGEREPHFEAPQFEVR